MKTQQSPLCSYFDFVAGFKVDMSPSKSFCAAGTELVETILVLFHLCQIDPCVSGQFTSASIFYFLMSFRPCEAMKKILIYFNCQKLYGFLSHEEKIY
jgi:hypothetical protein